MQDGGLVAQVTPKGGFPTRDSRPWPAPPPTRVAFVADDRILALEPRFSGGRADLCVTRMAASPGSGLADAYTRVRTDPAIAPGRVSADRDSGLS